MHYDTLNISSRHRTSGNKTKFSIVVPACLSAEYYILKYARFTNTFYNFRNDVVIFDDGAPVNVTLNGNYSATSLAAAIDAALPATYIITYNTDLQRLVFTNTAPFTITFATQYAANAFGFPDQGLLISSGIALSITASDPPELQRYQNLFILITELGSSGLSQGTSYSYIVPVSANRDEMFHYEVCYFTQHVKTSANNLHKTFEITVLGDDGQPIPSTEMSEWNMILEV